MQILGQDSVQINTAEIMSTPSSATASLPLAINLQMLGLLVESRRAKLGLNLVEAAYGARVSPSVLVRLEAGKPSEQILCSKC